ncbi:NAD(P)-binding protein [Rhizoclosmatium globosum]|uniref:NAD(P)-binding protein n=1 Tax=Rhizoclosmatium globosum TaxID=329046 RepID=A0A1Y2B8R8_9FUNG|nr:NAD(P)-binding protein [Rhizoclosmatium globosum]|eukprot:ORY31144.1 NAD(P)-binding protein [Rhizoclosmatium globosum]
MVYSVSNKVAFVTGGGSGFGELVSQRLASKGALVIVCDIVVEKGRRVAEGLGDRGFFVAADVSDQKSLAAAFEEGVKKWGRVDIMVNNAGIVEPPNGFVSDSEADWKLVMDVDLYSVIHGTQLALNQFRKQTPHGGIIINVASMAGFLPDISMPIYATAKAGVVMLTRSLGGKLVKTQNVRVVGIAPTFAMTNMGKFALANPVTKKYVEASSVPVSLVIDAFMRAIEDESLAGDILRVTSQKGIDVLPRRDLAQVTLAPLKKESKI